MKHRHSINHRSFIVPLLLVVFGLSAGCSGSGNETSSGAAHTPAMAADNQSSELFDWSYGYLMKGDPEFTKLAPNYSTLRPFTRDTSLVVESESEHQGQANPEDGFVESFHVRINKPLTIRFIVADSTGNGLITYEWPQVEAGSYTLGSKGWPGPQRMVTDGHDWVYVYFVGDRRFRARYKFRLDEKRHFTHMDQSEPAG